MTKQEIGRRAIKRLQARLNSTGAKILSEEQKAEKRAYFKSYYQANKERMKKSAAAWQKEKLKTDPEFKLRYSLRLRLNRALKGRTKIGSHIELLGCSVETLRRYLESKFQPGMTWENHGLYGWHIDHIIPLSSFDLTNPKQLKKACNYKNLQPLWAQDNLIKSDKLE